MVLPNPDLALVIGGQYKTGNPTSSVMDLVSAGGVHFRSFAKSAEFRQGMVLAYHWQIKTVICRSL